MNNKVTSYEMVRVDGLPHKRNQGSNKHIKHETLHGAEEEDKIFKMYAIK